MTNDFSSQRRATDVDAESVKPKIVFINRSYWPDAEATGQLLTDLCEDLAQQFDVTVIAGQPNQNPTHARFVQSGTERRNGVEIRRVNHFKFKKSSIVGRLFNILSFLFNAFWIGLWIPSPRVLVVETDPPLLCMIGSFLRVWHRSKYVIYLQDIYPDVAVALGKVPDGWPVRLLRRLFFSIYRSADRIVVLSDDMRDLLRESQVKEDSLVRIPNWADTRGIYPVKVANPFRLTHGLNGKFVVMYSGNMGLSQRLEHLLEAAEHLRDRTDVRFLLIGDGASRPYLEEIAAAKALSNVTFLDYQAREQLCFSLSCADLQLVVLDPKLAKCMMPSKLYGILAAGTPVMTAAPDDCELSRVTESERVGLVVGFNDPKRWAETIEWSLEHRAELAEMGKRARALADRDYDRRRSTRAFAELLASLCPAQTKKLDNAVL